MLTKIVDLTELCVVKQVQYILVELEKDWGNLILQDSYYQQQLIEYVLSNLNHRFMMLELTEIPQDASDVFPQCPIDEQIAIRQLLQKKMSQIGRYVGDGHRLIRRPKGLVSHSWRYRSAYKTTESSCEVCSTGETPATQLRAAVTVGQHDSLETQSQKMKNTFTSKSDSQQRKREVKCEEGIRPCLIEANS